MPITGKLLFSGQWHAGLGAAFTAVNPASGETLPTRHGRADDGQISNAVQCAGQALESYRLLPIKQRAAFLRCCADEIMALGDELTSTMQAETGYPPARCEGERARTTGQLRLFADYIEAGHYLDPRIDTALPERKPLARPDIRSQNQAIGVVTVFAVSNFPLAFSTAGGDTAAALAAGCPVIVKGHASHPGTGELVAQALHTAVEKCGMPKGTFSFVQCDHEAAKQLIQSAPVQAVAFTGSQRGGIALSKLAAERDDPIPVFAEMGSINPLIVLPGALQQNAAGIASGFVASLTLGTGQFCVNPGLVLGIAGRDFEAFMEETAKELSASSAGVMLNAAICEHYDSGVAKLGNTAGVVRAGIGQPVRASAGSHAQAALFRVNCADFLANPTLSEEVFGPVSVCVVCKNTDELLQALSQVPGQLTGTVHGTDKDLQEHPALLQLLSRKVGRIVINGFPTGVEVCHAMVHGGPFPASTDARFTSVGTAAIRRFLRPVCYQNYPEVLLPDALRNANPLGIMRLVNGTLSNAAL